MFPSLVNCCTIAPRLNSDPERRADESYYAKDWFAEWPAEASMAARAAESLVLFASTPRGVVQCWQAADDTGGQSTRVPSPALSVPPRIGFF